MKISLEEISKLVAEVRESEYALLEPTDSFEELGVDSLGRLMLIVGVATEYNIEGTEEQVVELVYQFKTIKDVIDYVESHSD